MKELFVLNGRLRSIWRFFIAAAWWLSPKCRRVSSWGCLFGIAGREPAHVIFWASCLTLPALLAVFKILTCNFDGKPLGSIGLAFYGRWKTELGTGMASGRRDGAGGGGTGMGMRRGAFCLEPDSRRAGAGGRRLLPGAFRRGRNQRGTDVSRLSFSAPG